MVDLLLNDAIDQYFSSYTQQIDSCLDETRAYIESIFRGFVRPTTDFSKDSVTLLYIRAKESGEFETFQRLGDWIFFTRSIYPESLRVSPGYYDAIAQNSYYRCHIILDKKWPCFEELADKFPYFVEAVRI